MVLGSGGHAKMCIEILYKQDNYELRGKIVEKYIKYINEKKPWETGDKNAVANARELVDQVAELLTPFLPETSEKIIKGEPGTLFPRL